jgi:leucyl aminopeptidase
VADSTVSSEASRVAGAAVVDGSADPAGAAGAAGAAASRRPVFTLADGASGVSGAAVSAVLVAAVDGAPAPTDDARRAGAQVGVDLDALLEAEGAKADAGSVVVVPLARRAPPTRLLVVGLGAGRGEDWRAAGAGLARRVGSAARVAVVGADDAAGLRIFAEAFALAAYSSSGVGSVAGAENGAGAVPAENGAGAVPADGGAGAAPADSPDRAVAEAASASASSASARLDEVAVLAGSPADPGLASALAAADVVAEAVYLARDLVNTPAAVATPQWLAGRAVELAGAAGVEARVFEPAELAAAGFGGLLAVGGASVHPPRLVQLSYTGPDSAGGPEVAGGAALAAGGAALAARGAAVAGGPAPGHRVLVGKGITFDSGGLSLKPATPMIPMKTDMSGAAAVLAVMAALPRLGVPGRVSGLLCLAENMIGASAMRPGDVVTCWGGTTVEVLNTDAEGRLVLADALAYAAATLAPEAIVDLATLTGAITVALGRRTAGLFASDDALAAALTAAGAASGERMWRLPLVEEYRPAIDSPVADVANIGRSLEVSGGSITAALFLREFTAGLPWAHLDIAGTARADGDDGEISRGGTGWGVRTLLHWLRPPPPSE